MEAIIKGAGIFIYPLGICSFMVIFVIIERLIALRAARVMPKALTEAFITGEILNYQGNLDSVAGRIVAFYRKTNSDPEALKAFARLEVARLERGIFILEIVTTGAPLLGLLGTIVGLFRLFSNQASKGALTNVADFGGSISLALITTMLGICVAIPALVGNSYLCRRVDLLSARLDMGVERLIDLSKRSKM